MDAACFRSTEAQFRERRAAAARRASRRTLVVLRREFALPKRTVA